MEYFTSDAVNSLIETASENFDWYYSQSEIIDHSVSMTSNLIRTSSVQVDSLKDKLAISYDKKTRHELDAENALTVFEALRNLTQVQATDERLWVYLCHTECKNYASSRWLNHAIPDDNEKIRQEISHFFVSSRSKNRNLFRHNAISRLWWMGFLAHQVFPDEPDHFLNLLLFDQDIANQILTRSFTRNPRILKVIFEILKQDWHNENLFKRTVFRDWMSRVNYFGGVVLLDALPEDQLQKKVEEFATAVLISDEAIAE